MFATIDAPSRTISAAQINDSNRIPEAASVNVRDGGRFMAAIVAR